MAEMVKVRVNNRWDLLLPDFRAHRPGWSWWEQDALAALHAVIRPGDVVWDVGSELGDLAALYASWGAEVLCIEPETVMWPWIKSIFEANGLYPRGTIRARVGAWRAASSPAAWIWPLSAADEPMPYPESQGDCEVLCALDQVCEADQPQVIVMDIEGAEYQALLGAERLLTDVRPIWMISIHPEHLRRDYGDTPDDMLCHMEKMGYDAHRISYDHEHHWLFKPLPQ